MALALLRKPGAVTPPRAVLAHAIEAHVELLTSRERVDQALAAARADEINAIVAIERAEEAIEDARDAAGAYARDKALGRAVEPPLTVRQARDALADAQDAREAARSAIGLLEAQQVRVSLLFSERDLKAAAIAVVRSERAVELRAVAERVAELQRDLVREGRALTALVRLGAFEMTNDVDHRGELVDEVVRSAYARLNSPTSTWTELQAQVAAPDTWTTALAALERDAKSPLPAEASS